MKTLHLPCAMAEESVCARASAMQCVFPGVFGRVSGMAGWRLSCR